MVTHRPPALRATEKWKEAATTGFQVVPDVLLKNQDQLGLSATDLVVALNLMMHWWYREQRPFPRSTTIARRMGIDVRTVQRSLARLRELKLMTREVEKLPDGGTRQVCDLSGLQEKLCELAKMDPIYVSRQPHIEVKDDL